jgi:hypothetical protein
VVFAETDLRTARCASENGALEGIVSSRNSAKIKLWYAR